MRVILIEAPPRIETYDRETRAYNDATTWLAETLNGPMRTPFEYTFDGRELYADDGGALEPVFEKAIKDAEELAEANTNLVFELRRRQIEKAEYHDMLKMASGELPNTMITVSDFPPELMDASEDVGGYNTNRKQTMLRVITLTPEGKLKMYSQSLDGSSRLALEEIYKGFGLRPEPGELLGQRIYTEQDAVEQEFLVDKLAGIYDRDLEAQTGRGHRAGRPLPEKNPLETHQFACSQPDLISHLTKVMLAGQLSQKVMFSVAATMSERYEQACSGEPGSESHATRRVMNPEAFSQVLAREMGQATARARAAGRSFSGCGASVSSPEDLSGKEQMDGLGYGNKTTRETNYKFDKKMHCKVCQAPPKSEAEPKKMCGPCGICQGCDKKLAKKSG